MKGMVYLAGPITGVNYQGCTDWRKHAVTRLAEHGIKGLDPMRGKEYLKAIAKDKPFTCDGDAYAVQGPLSTNRGITTRDRWDATRCDVLLVNLHGDNLGTDPDGKPRISIGTIMEIAWADANRIPIVCVMEPGNPHDHGMVREVIGFRVVTLEDALDLVIAMLR